MEQNSHSHRVPIVERDTGNHKHKTNASVLFSDLGNLTTMQKKVLMSGDGKHALKWGSKDLTLLLNYILHTYPP